MDADRHDSFYAPAAPARPPRTRRRLAGAATGAIAFVALSGAVYAHGHEHEHGTATAPVAPAAVVTPAAMPTPSAAPAVAAARPAPARPAARAKQARVSGAPAAVHGASVPVIAPPNPDPVRIAPPAGAPPSIVALIHGANLISGLPYRWGGGHQTLADNAYDCSGSVSYALNWAGMLTGTRTSGQLAHWGVNGPGRWLTVYANAKHTFLVVRGLRFDTRGLRDQANSRWLASPADTTGYAARHWPGL